MKCFSTINRYVFQSLLPPFFISLLFLTFVFLMGRIPEITRMVMNRNADLSAVFMMMAYMLPRFMEFTIPMSVMIAVLLTFMRMAGENELIALKGAGLSIYRLLPPVLVFCLAGILVTLWFTVAGIPWSRLSLKRLTLDLARSNMEMALQERQFNSELDKVVIYIAQADIKTGRLTDVFIEDRRARDVVGISIAPSGELIQSEAAVYTIRLHDGVINQVNAEQGSVNHIYFRFYDINLDLSENMEENHPEITKRLNEEKLGDLIRLIRSGIQDEKKRRSALMELHEKLAIPFACLSLGLLAFPLGVQSNALRKSSGFGLGVSFFIIYYLLLAAGWSAGETGQLPPAAAMWLPNAVMGGAGVYLLYRNAREKPVSWPSFAVRAVQALRNRIVKKG